MFGPVVVAEVGMGRTACEQQHVEVERAAIVQFYAIRIGVDADHRRHPHFDIALRAQDVPQWRRDVRRRQAGGRDLIQQWLEQMMVAAIHQGDPHHGRSKSAHGPQAGETATDYHDVR